MNAINHFKTITTHKILVMKDCFKIGLYKQGLLHDLSKYMPSEFMVGVRYYQGDRSPNTAEVEEKGYSTAWLHHKGRNRHHFEYYIDFSVRGDEPLRIAPMPKKYIAEMLVDRVVACKVYNKENFKKEDPLAYYNRGDTGRFLHPYTKKNIEGLLKMYAMKGEKYTYSYIKNVFLKNTRVNRKAGK